MALSTQSRIAALLLSTFAVVALPFSTMACAPLPPAQTAEPPIATGRGHQMSSQPPPQAASPNTVSPRAPIGVEHGKATYYSDRLAGRSTASGEPYDPRAYTAAHKKWPFGTRVRVVRTDSARQVVVTINDRGPFGPADRIIDLSKVAAEQLDMIRAGVVPVRLEVLEYGGDGR